MLQIFCCVCAWTLVILSAWSILKTTREGLEQFRKMHQIPCHNCKFFTGNYHLKCTVHPLKAMSEEVIDCRDFEPISYASQNFYH